MFDSVWVFYIFGVLAAVGGFLVEMLINWVAGLYFGKGCYQRNIAKTGLYYQPSGKLSTEKPNMVGWSIWGVVWFAFSWIAAIWTVKNILEKSVLLISGMFEPVPSRTLELRFMLSKVDMPGEAVAVRLIAIAIVGGYCQATLSSLDEEFKAVEERVPTFSRNVAGAQRG